MSAIAVLVQTDGALAVTRELGGMLDRMAAYRHVDARSEWAQGPAALGHLLERRTPEDAWERQPLVDAQGRFCLAGDVRLDNRAELAVALGIESARARRLGDGELVLEAWRRWGPACPERLLGDFAFAVWDSEAGTLFCARDHLGVRPLYFARTARGFAVASAVKGLLALPDVDGRLDEVALADYLVALEEDLERTFYVGIRRLPAGHSLMLEAGGGVRLRRYWRPDPDHEVELRSDHEYTERLRELLRRAVECRMRSTSNTAVLLSGGLDSSVVACLAADTAAAASGRIAALASVLPPGFTGPERDEWDYICAVADSRPNIDVLRVAAPGCGLLTGLDDTLAISDQPFRDLFHYMTRALLEAAAGRGARNVLWGYGGDSVVSSHAVGYLAELFGRGRLVALAHELRERRRVQGTAIRSQLLARVIRPMLPALAYSAFEASRGRDAPSRIRASAVHPALAERVDLKRRLRASALLQPPRRSVRAGEVRALMDRSLSEDLEYGAQIAAALGVSLHVPLLDKRLVEFCLALPARQKARDGWTRLAMRRAMEGVVPSPVCWRRDKGAFSPDFERRVRGERGAILELLGALEADAELRDYVAVDRIRAVLGDRNEGAGGEQGLLEMVSVVGAGVVAARHLQRAPNR